MISVLLWGKLLLYYHNSKNKTKHISTKMLVFSCNFALLPTWGQHENMTRSSLELALGVCLSCVQLFIYLFIHSLVYLDCICTYMIVVLFWLLCVSLYVLVFFSFDILHTFVGVFLVSVGSIIAFFMIILRFCAFILYISRQHCCLLIDC